MRAIILTLFLAATVGCVHQPPPLLPPTLTNPTSQLLIPGREYAVEITRPKGGAKITYQGKVVRADENTVVFDAPVMRAKLTQSPPIPIIGKMFQNKSIAAEQLKGEISVARGQIIAVSDVSAKASGAIRR